MPGQPDGAAGFVPGLELCEAFYHEAVVPVLERRFPGLGHAAGRLDTGSEVLGFDTPQSMDHGWGPAKLTLFLGDAEARELGPAVSQALAEDLPHTFRGFPADFSRPEVEGESRAMELVTHGPVAHDIAVTSVRGFFLDYLGADPVSGLSARDWLLIPQQRLRTVASGRVFHDGLGTLTPIREALRWYPHDVWCYLLSCQWQRISQEEPFMARCGDVGDELGSRLVAARMVTELMRLCFLMEQQHWPYSKWFGTAFSRLESASELAPVLRAVLDSQTWREREQHLSAAYVAVARRHNSLGLTESIEPGVSLFFDRPYRVPHAGRFAGALRRQIANDTVRSLPAHVGSVSQHVDGTDVLDSIERCRRMAALYL